MMKEYVIDCGRIDGLREFHFVLAKQLRFPGWYGNNLDALYDCLTDIQEDTRLILTGFSSLPGFARGFQTVFTDAAGKNPHFQVIFA